MRYVIELATPVSEELLAAFPGFVRVSSRRSPAILVGTVADDSDLHSALGRIQTLGLSFIRVERLEPDVLTTTGADPTIPKGA